MINLMDKSCAMFLHPKDNRLKSTSEFWLMTGDIDPFSVSKALTSVARYEFLETCKTDYMRFYLSRYPEKNIPDHHDDYISFFCLLYIMPYSYIYQNPSGCAWMLIKQNWVAYPDKVSIFNKNWWIYLILPWQRYAIKKLSGYKTNFIERLWWKGTIFFTNLQPFGYSSSRLLLWQIYKTGVIKMPSFVRRCKSLYGDKWESTLFKIYYANSHFPEMYEYARETLEG